MQCREHQGKFQVFIRGRWCDWKDVSVLKEGRWRPWRNLAEARRDSQEENEEDLDLKEILLGIEKVLDNRDIKDDQKLTSIHNTIKMHLKDLRGEGQENEDDPPPPEETEEQKRWRKNRQRELTEDRKRIKEQAATPEGALAALLGSGF